MKTREEKLLFRFWILGAVAMIAISQVLVVVNGYNISLAQLLVGLIYSSSVLMCLAVIIRGLNGLSSPLGTTMALVLKLTALFLFIFYLSRLNSVEVLSSLLGLFTLVPVGIALAISEFLQEQRA